MIHVCDPDYPNICLMLDQIDAVLDQIEARRRLK
jgi:hypothetical protein